MFPSHKKTNKKKSLFLFFNNYFFVAAGILLGYSSEAWSNQLKQSTSAEIQSHLSTRDGERLSQWLLRKSRQDTDYLPGLMWFAASEKSTQEDLKQKLLQAMDLQQASAKLIEWIRTREVTGRVIVASGDPLWLTANPSQNPVLSANDKVKVPQRPKSVNILLENGHICQARHQSAALAVEYMRACAAPNDFGDTVWIIQPNGEYHVLGIGAWNAEAQILPQPGAWLWAPKSTSKINASTSNLLAKFLGTQGALPDRATSTYRTNPHETVWSTAGVSSHHRLQDHQIPTRSLPISANDWGETGLLQTPTARMEDAGTVRAHISRTSPYTRMSVFLQPFDWLETGFRYTDIADRQYDPSGQIASQSYKDKSLDLKIRLWPESRHIPQLALGIRDIGGTGLFAGEYLVANKRTHNIDWSLGLGWGYLGTRGDVTNPFSLLVPQAKNRGQVNVGQGGETNFNNMFRGPAAIFGGLQWHTPWQPLSLKLEIEGNNYQREPSGKGALGQRTPFNFGATYQYSPNIEFNMGLERGNTFTAGITFRSRLSQTGTPKPFDPPAPEILPYQTHSDKSLSTTALISTTAPSLLKQSTMGKFQQTAVDVEEITDWSVQRIWLDDNYLNIEVEDNGTIFKQARIEKLLSILHRDSPPEVDQWKIRFSQNGLGVTERLYDREIWTQSKLQALTPTARAQILKDTAPTEAAPLDPTKDLSAAAYIKNRNFNFEISPSFWQSFGGPDAFMLYQIGVRADAQYRITPATWISGNANLQLIDNYDKFKYTAPSQLPRVRTHIREYVTQSELTISNLQLTHAKQLTTNQYASIYGGWLESMYAGLGAEWLYRPLNSSFAIGLDINHVRQRSFNLGFSLRDYEVNTGHATVYWDTKWEGVKAKLSIGQYLARDKGATLDISRTFNNGVIIGAWATKTNISAQQFGEGSFDKGIYVQLPFDIFLPRSSSSKGTFVWQPLLRDGGARLNRSVQLHTLTEGRDSMAWQYRPVSTIPSRPSTGADLFKP